MPNHFGIGALLGVFAGGFILCILGLKASHKSEQRVRCLVEISLQNNSTLNTTRLDWCCVDVKKNLLKLDSACEMPYAWILSVTLGSLCMLAALVVACLAISIRRKRSAGSTVTKYYELEGDSELL